MNKPAQLYEKDYNLIKAISEKEDWSIIKTLSKAIKNFAKAKKIWKQESAN